MSAATTRIVSFERFCRARDRRPDRQWAESPIRLPFTSPFRSRPLGAREIAHRALMLAHLQAIERGRRPATRPRARIPHA